MEVMLWWSSSSSGIAESSQTLRDATSSCSRGTWTNPLDALDGWSSSGKGLSGMSSKDWELPEFGRMACIQFWACEESMVADKSRGTWILDQDW